VTPDSKLHIALSGAVPPFDNGGLWAAIRVALSRNGFVVPPLRPIRQGTSSHYAASLPLGNGIVGSDGRLADGIYVCDSAGFQDGPALSPTLTIIANAARIAHCGL
jgi:hypothetical protein